MDIINIKKDNKIIMTIGMKYTLGYDNFQWWKLSELISNIEQDKSLNEDNGYYMLDNEASKYAEAILDLDNKTINNIPSFPIFEFEEVNKDNCCIDLLKKEDRYYAYYEDGDEEVLMPEINYDNEALLRNSSGAYTFDEIKQISDFVDTLIEDGGLSDFVLNKKCVIRLNNI